MTFKLNGVYFFCILNLWCYYCRRHYHSFPRQGNFPCNIFWRKWEVEGGCNHWWFAEFLKEDVRGEVETFKSCWFLPRRDFGLVDSHFDLELKVTLCSGRRRPKLMITLLASWAWVACGLDSCAKAPKVQICPKTFFNDCSFQDFRKNSNVRYCFGVGFNLLVVCRFTRHRLLLWQCYDEIHDQQHDKRMKNWRQFVYFTHGRASITWHVQFHFSCKIFVEFRVRVPLVKVSEMNAVNKRK